MVTMNGDAYPKADTTELIVHRGRVMGGDGLKTSDVKKAFVWMKRDERECCEKRRVYIEKDSRSLH